MNTIAAGRIIPHAPHVTRTNGLNGGLRKTRPTLGLLGLLLVLFSTFAQAAEVIPPVPPNHFNDYAGVTRRDTAQKLNAELAQFERDTSNQLVVAIYPRMQSNSSVEDYAVRVAQQWRVGQKERKNGAVLFLFQESHDVRIVTGYGLEGALPDARCKQIIENEMIPRFRAGNFDAGLTAGVHALMAAARGEYRGPGRTAADRRTNARDNGDLGFWTFVLFISLVFVGLSRLRRNTIYSRRGRQSPWIDSGPWGGGSPWGSGGSSGSGGTFSGGGGSFGGGGAGGKW